jgi:hypothetical protein
MSSATAQFALLIKEAIANMPDTLNTKKEIDEHYKKAMKEINDQIKEEKKANKKTATKDPKEPKAPKDVKKRTKKAKDVDEDGNEIVKVKKPLNNYQKFIQEQRPKVKEDYPDLSGEEIFTKIAELWKKHKEDIVENKNDEIAKIDSGDNSDSGKSESGNESDWNKDEEDDVEEAGTKAASTIVVVEDKKKATKAVGAKSAKPAAKK